MFPEPWQYSDFVKVPTNADEAVLMLGLALDFLKTHAPERLRPEFRKWDLETPFRDLQDKEEK